MQAGKDEFGKKYFQHQFVPNDDFYVSIVVPIVHYCMGGLACNTEAAVLDKNGKPIPGLWCAGEVRQTSSSLPRCSVRPPSLTRAPRRWRAACTG